jgi:hypothetical protein
MNGKKEGGKLTAPSGFPPRDHLTSFLKQANKNYLVGGHSGGRKFTNGQVYRTLFS